MKHMSLVQLLGSLLPTTIRARLLLLLVMTASMVGVIGGVGWFGIQSGNRAIAALNDEGVVAVSTMGDLRDAFGKLARFEMDMLVNFESPPLTDEAKAQWLLAYEATVSKAQALRERFPDAQAIEELDALLAGVASYKKGVDELIPKLERGEILSAGVGNQLMIEHRAGFLAASAAVADLQQLVQARAADRLASATTRSHRLILLSIGVAGLGTLAVVLTGLVIVRSIRVQVARAARMTARISNGDLTAKTSEITSGRDEIGELMRNLDSMRLELHALVAGVQDGASSISNASAEISHGSLELSRRTEQSATDLQSMSSVAQELDTFATQSAISTAQSVRLSQSVADRAKAAAAAASHAASCIRLIEANAKKISEITNVMDMIAFQTNMLAINAAVEAAHAGEHGRGFGVVAQEIQTLAKRSATAANDIKVLLKESTGNVVSGVSAVGAADQAVSAITAATDQMSEQTTQLLSQTEALAERIAQVRERVERVEDVTLQNSALSEESSAAAASLKEQVQRLNQLVDVFKL